MFSQGAFLGGDERNGGTRPSWRVDKSLSTFCSTGAFETKRQAPAGPTQTSVTSVKWRLGPRCAAIRASCCNSAIFC